MLPVVNTSIEAQTRVAAVMDAKGHLPFLDLQEDDRLEALREERAEQTREDAALLDWIED